MMMNGEPMSERQAAYIAGGPQEPPKEKFGTWATLELFGHVRLQGYVQECDLFGTTMVQIDVIGEDGGQGETRYYGAAAVYSCRPCSEEEIKAEIEQRRQWAARRAALMERPALSARVTEETDDDEDDEDKDEDDEEAE